MSASGSDQTSQDSKLLYQLCCDVGFSLDKWKERLKVSDVSNTCHSYKGLLYGATCLDSGSFGEGVGMDFLDSDVDVMAIIRGTSVIEGNDVRCDESDHVYQMIKSSHPAFMNLVLLSIGTTEDKSIVQTQIFCEPDEEGKLLLNGDKMKTRFQTQGDIRHGPALKVTGQMLGNTEMDKVTSLHGVPWPSVAEEWIHRKRSFNWPSSDVIQQIVDNGCELVSVGSHRSIFPHLEWRLSSSMAEKRLVRTFNIYQIQCYFLLKLILASLVKPFISDQLCSYHMKTVMLHVVETTDPAIWREDNLTNCFMTCLHRLFSYLHVGVCPQYFILQHNLFDPKIQGESRRILLRIVGGLLSEGWKCILRCPPFFQLCRHPEVRCPCHTSHWKDYCDHLHVEYIGSIVRFHFDIYDIMSSHCSTIFTETVTALVKLQKNDTMKLSNHFPSHKMLVAFRNHFKLTIGLVLLNMKAIHCESNHRVLHYAKRRVEEGKGAVSISCKLKYATFIYLTGDTDKCLQVVNGILMQYEHGVIPGCIDSDREYAITPLPDYRRRLVQFLHQCNTINSAIAKFVYPVVFSKWEIQSCLPGVRRVAERRTLVTEYDYKYPSILFVDCVVYIHYMLFLCYSDMGRRAESRQALDMLRHIVEHPTQHYVFYPDIARLLYEYI